MKRAGFLLTVFFVPTFAFASEEAISRRDGFLVLWQSIQRKTEETRESPFTDVPEGTLGYAEITYAKRRGILDDTQDRFRPDDSLMLKTLCFGFSGREASMRSKKCGAKICRSCWPVIHSGNLLMQELPLNRQQSRIAQSRKKNCCCLCRIRSVAQRGTT